MRIDFINARDRVSIEQGIDVRSNPLAVPTFNPYTIRLHRFWVPLQLYHPELRTNSSKFDMNDLSLNWVPAVTSVSDLTGNSTYSYTNSLGRWLRFIPVIYTTRVQLPLLFRYLLTQLLLLGRMPIRILLIGISSAIIIAFPSGVFFRLLGQPRGLISWVVCNYVHPIFLVVVEFLYAGLWKSRVLGCLL